MSDVTEERTDIEKLADPTIEHSRIPHQPAWQADDWHCICGWFGNHNWQGFAVHLQEVLRLRANGLLDVERLARALNASVGTVGWLHLTPPSPVDEWRLNARIIANEYAT